MDNNSFNNDNHLTYEELVAYSKGNLSNKEMHRLELHLINCELCNEATDGITNVEVSMLDKSLAGIRARTATKASKGISITRKQVLAIAASLALIAVVSIVFLLIPNKQDAMLAEKLTEQEESLLADDTTTEKTEDGSYNITLKEDSVTAIANASVPQYVAKEVLASEVIEEEAIGLTVSDLPIEVADLAGPSDTSLLADNIIRESTVNGTKAEAVEEEEMAAEDRERAARAKKLAAPVAGAETEALQETPATIYQAAEPEKGMRAYIRYLKRNLKYPDAAKENNVEGDVVLELSINGFGSITNINVVQSLGYGCDQEAIRLVREGPKWVPGMMNNSTIDDKVMVTVPFKL